METIQSAENNSGWRHRLRGAMGGVLLGVLLFFGSFVLLFLNEGRSVKTFRSLKEGAGTVISVQSARIATENEGSLVHVTGRVEAGTPLRDGYFPVQVQDLGLRRSVEMFQWVEESKSEKPEKPEDGAQTVTTYFYGKIWSHLLIDSSRFHDVANHANPPGFPVESRKRVAEDARLGAFSIPSTLVERLEGWHPVVLREDFLPAPESDAARRWRVLDDRLVLAADAENPEIGDLRVLIETLPETEASIIGKQSGSTLHTYHTKAGGSVLLIENGIKPADDLFQTAHSSNRTLTWLLRTGGFLIMFMGMNLIARPIEVAVSALPFLGRLVSLGTGLAALAIAFALSLITIGAAWLAYRPALAVLLLVGAGAVLAAGFVLGFHRKLPLVKNKGTAN